MESSSDNEASSELESEDETPTIQSVSSGKGTAPASANRLVSDDAATDDDIDDDEDVQLKNPQPSSIRKDGQKRRSKKRDTEPSLPRRGRSGSTSFDVDDDEDSNSKPRKSRTSSGSGSDTLGGGDSVGKPKKSKRHSTVSEAVGGADDDDGDIPTSSFHKLAKDADKKLGSNSKHKTKRRQASSGVRRAKERVVEAKDPNEDIDDDEVDEFGEEEHEVKLKGDDEDGHEEGGNRRSRSSGTRPPSSRRGQPMRRSSSERFRRAIEGETEEADDRGQNLSRSSHGSVRRRAVSSESLGSASYHGSSERSRTRTPNKRPTRRGMYTPNSDCSGNYDHELNLSGRSARTLDSIEDLEDLGHVDFQTPGMANYDAEILELMRKANPEHTAQLQRRVGRRREAVNHDQDMPRMTRQALMTRTGSTQVQRQFVDQSILDKRGMMVRSMSNSSELADEMSMLPHRQQLARGAPSRRPPPRTRSSGMALSMTDHHPSDDKRRVFRTKSGASTSSFRQTQKPNRVQPIPRRPGDMDTSRSNRAAPEDRNGSLSRARSMHATVGRAAVSPKKPERRIPKGAESTSGHETSAEKQAELDDSSISEDSDVESDEDGKPITTIRRKFPPLKIAPKPVMPPKPKSDKRDFTVKRNRAKLHSMLYESKMGVDMHDLLETVRQGEITRSPWKALMMPSP
jgi:hypothetical protein